MADELLRRRFIKMPVFRCIRWFIIKWYYQNFNNQQLGLHIFICYVTWGRSEPFLYTLQEVNFCQASNISSCWLQFFASCRIITPCKKLWVWLLVFTNLVKNSSYLAFFEIFCTNTKKQFQLKLHKMQKMICSLHK